MVNPIDDLTKFDYQPLNAMPSDYDLGMPQPMGSTDFDNVEMFLDPQFWPSDLGTTSVNQDQNQSFSGFGAF